jgi:predicted MFS family arabinose efflux permease
MPATILSEPILHPDEGRRLRVNLVVLIAAQALYVLMASIDLTLTGLVGYRIAPSHALATLPYALIFIAGTISPSPAALLMARAGRRTGFMVGAAFAAVGGLVSVWAVATHDFLLFCAGTALVGAYQGFAVYYRYAAADDTPAERRPRVISYVVGAGVVAAVGGPFIAIGSRHLLAATYAGSYAVISLLALATIVVLLPLRMPPAAGEERDERGVVESAGAPRRPLRAVLSQGVFLVGVAGMAIGYFVMMLLMTVAPIAGEMSHHSTEQGAMVIQWHLIGMFAPSLASGILVARLGAEQVLAVGTAVAVLATTVDLVGTSQLNLLLALGGIGVAWNLMQVAGTTMVVQSYRPAERIGTQAAAESSTAVAATLGALCSGVLLDTIGWRSLNVVALCALALPTALAIWYLAGPRRLGLARGATSSTR